MGIRVLLVDDVIAVRSLLRTALRVRGGFEVLGEAGDGGEAVRLAGSLQPDLIVLDLGLPDIAG
ncbi:MAG TPA: response regulator, partial [Microlunatus sp.]|nr:response regulator [Microlunatus sp.]